MQLCDSGRLSFLATRYPVVGAEIEQIRGRTFARYETIFQLCWVAGAGIATLVPFASRGGLRTLAAICFGGIALSIYGLARRASAAPPVNADTTELDVTPQS